MTKLRYISSPFRPGDSYTSLSDAKNKRTGFEIKNPGTPEPPLPPPFTPTTLETWIVVTESVDEERGFREAIYNVDTNTITEGDFIQKSDLLSPGDGGNFFIRLRNGNYYFYSDDDAVIKLLDSNFNEIRSISTSEFTGSFRSGSLEVDENYNLYCLSVRTGSANPDFGSYLNILDYETFEFHDVLFGPPYSSREAQALDLCVTKDYIFICSYVSFEESFVTRINRSNYIQSANYWDEDEFSGRPTSMCVLDTERIAVVDAKNDSEIFIFDYDLNVVDRITELDIGTNSFGGPTNISRIEATADHKIITCNSNNSMFYYIDPDTKTSLYSRNVGRPYQLYVNSDNFAFVNTGLGSDSRELWVINLNTEDSAVLGKSFASGYSVSATFYSGWQLYKFFNLR